MSKPQIKRVLRRAKGYWHNRQLIRTKSGVPSEDFVAVPCANDGKIILMAIDALTWSIMDPLMEQGKLPNLRALKEGGSYGSLRTICPALSPELWNTIATGKLPKKHGIVGFMVSDPKTRKLIPYTSNMRRCKAIWEILGDYKKRVGVVGWWNSWPAEPINGSMVSGILGYKIKDIKKVKNEDSFADFTRKPRITAASFRQQTYPEELFDEIKRFIRPLSHFGDSHDFLRRIWEHSGDMELSEMESLKLLTKIYNIDRTYKDIATYVYTKTRPDFLAFYIAGIDVAGHKYWAYMEPERFSNTLPSSKIELYGTLIHDYYTYVDEIVGEFIEMADEGTTIAVVSDHGMSPDDRLFRKTKINCARHFAEDGVFVFAGPHIKEDNSVRGKTSVLDITPTLLRLMGLPIAVDMDGSSIEEVFSQEFTAENSLRFVPTYDGTRKYDNAPVESPVDDEIKERLKSLGYID